MQDTTIQN